MGAPSHSGVLSPQCFGHRITVGATSPCQGTWFAKDKAQQTAAQPPNSNTRRRRVGDALLSWPCITDATAMLQQPGP